MPLAFKLCNVLLDFVLFLQCRGLSRLTLEDFELFLGVGKRLFGSIDHVVCPAIEPIALFWKVLVLPFRGPLDGVWGTAFSFDSKMILHMR
jgi:hypothetical protein